MEKEKDDIDVLTLAAANAHADEAAGEVKEELDSLGLKVVDGKLCQVYSSSN